MKIAYQIKAKNGALWEAAEKLGGVPALAKYLGLSYGYTIALMNMRTYPGHRRATSSVNWNDVEKKLVELTGLLLEDVFPEELQSSEFMDRPKSQTIVQDFELEQLSAAHDRIALPVNPEDELLKRDAIARALDTLSPREERVLRLRFGLNDTDGHERTLREIGEDFGLCAESIRRVEAKALRKLRHPSKTKQLKPFIHTRRANA